MRYSGLIAAVIVLIGTGLIHGLWTDRWAISAEPEASAAKLANLPLNIGDWRSQPFEINRNELELGSIVGYVGRYFINDQTKSRVQVLIVCGRPGPISVHTPDVCFQGAGYHMTTTPAKIHVDSVPSHDFWQVSFAKEGTEGEKHIRALWAWSSDGQWQVPENPRWTFARSKSLFKLYVLRELSQPGLPPEKDPSLDLIRVLLPELKKCVFSEP